ncbi:hypothetical protein OPV22_017024 [Ensete ventricosum]|uniref:Uncharacterized protein n=1 Tax=Ensete ventricosum TaxID=4639 RepID=A0AAV8QME5_ENSVE|nr:hypothetical protein OPV22_017024 [Ensete ventricosum]
MIQMKGSGIKKMRRVEEPPKKAVLLNAGEERVETPLGVPAFLKEKKVSVGSTRLPRPDKLPVTAMDAARGPTSDFMRVTSFAGRDKGQNSNQGMVRCGPHLSRLFGVRAAGLLHRGVTANAGLVVFCDAKNNAGGH